MFRFNRLRIRAVTCLFLLGGSLAACSGNTEGLVGQELFEQTCAVCHGSCCEGSATRPAINQGSNAATFDDDQIRGVIRVGPGAMPAFKRLSDEQVDSLVAYLRELQRAAPADD